MIDEPLGPGQASQYRPLAAWANYIAVDCADAQYAIKERCRSMGSPTEGAWPMLKRLTRYLLGRPRAIINFQWQHEVKVIQMCSPTPIGQDVGLRAKARVVARSS